MRIKINLKFYLTSKVSVRYIWTHIESGRIYIGSAVNLSNRFKIISILII